MTGFTESFDDFLSTERQMQNVDLPPFQFREDKDKAGTLEWLIQNYDNQEAAAHSRRITYRRFQALYKNIHWRFFDTRDTRRDQEVDGRRPRHSVNFVREMVDSRVAQNARMKHNLAFVPTHDEQKDVNNAKLCKMGYDSYSEQAELEKEHITQDKATFLFGHSLMYICWEDDIGPYDPKYQRLMDKYPEGIPAKIKKQLGKEEIRLGDVRTETIGPDRFYVEPNKPKWMDIDYMEVIDFIHKDQVKHDYPKCADEIKDNQRQIYDFDSAELIRPQNLVVVRTFWHRPTKYFPEGCKITYCDDCILEWVEFPYEHGMLPAVPDKDVEIYGEFWGRSFIHDIEQMQRFYNSMQSAQARDFSWASAPKWLLPKGACDVNSLNNDLTIVEFSGPVPPKLATATFTPPQAMDLQDRIESKIAKHSRIYDISRGEVPQGVTANSALQFLDEQESQTILPQEIKRKRRVIKVAKMILALMQQYYSKDDGRMVKLLGDKNQYLMESLDGADFTKVHDVRPMNTSALPDTKVGKIASIVELNMATQTDPVFRKEEVVEMLQLGNDDYFTSRATVAVDAANTALDAIFKGKEIQPPRLFDELLVHYNVFCKGIQQYSFKESLEPDIQQRVDIHMKTLEMHMFERAKLNMKFCSKVMELDNYPMFFKPPMPITKVFSLHQQDAMGAPPPQSTAGMDTSKIETAQKGAKDN